MWFNTQIICRSKIIIFVKQTSYIAVMAMRGNLFIANYLDVPDSDFIQDSSSNSACKDTILNSNTIMPIRYFQLSVNLSKKN